MVNKNEPYAGDTSRSPVIGFITVTIISCILAAGIIVAHVPEPAPIWGSILWVCIAGALTIGSITLILRKKPFARRVFFKVAKWVFLYFLVLTGMGEYVLIFDGTRGETLIVITIILVLFLINIPMLWGFSVARHEQNAS